MIKSNEDTFRNYNMVGTKGMSRQEYKLDVDIALNGLSSVNSKYWNAEFESNLFVEEFINPIPDDIKVVFVNHVPIIFWIDTHAKNKTDGIDSSSPSSTIQAFEITGDSISFFTNCRLSKVIPDEFLGTFKDIIQKNKLKDFQEFYQKFNYIWCRE